ncbi:hypothetical protein O6H91_03G075700 [Diphasiastrum complanatum]|uniref:Uncharacterized protein n=1 Tax=Diphasiastrum complanatum TaxID=34168 RepID=A0ACC2E7I8_DIPCM|nr:hypothetical protein O6H91_03G075700 [Diphasiastrum complanatum]
MKLFNISPVFAKHRNDANNDYKASSSSTTSPVISESNNIVAAAPQLKTSHDPSKTGTESQSKSSPAPDELITSVSQLPSLRAAYYRFKAFYPKYKDTLVIDQLREDEYVHLSKDRRVYLNHHGLGLFSFVQKMLDQSSCSFGLSEVVTSLATNALYGGAVEGTMEYDLSKRIRNHFKVSDTEYGMVFTTDHASAFKLLGDSFSFSSNTRLLTVYDHENDSVNLMVQSATAKNAKIMSASFKWPSMRIRSTDLRKQLQEKKKKKENSKGLFVFPVQSKVTGAKYSYQWMTLAEKNQWHVLLDASALGPNDMDSLGLSLYRPDFIVCSFYKIFGFDASGFACLFIKNSSIHCLENNCLVASNGMVRIVPNPSEAKQLDEEAENDSQVVDEDHSSSYGYDSEVDISSVSLANGAMDRSKVESPISEDDSLKTPNSVDKQSITSNSHPLTEPLSDDGSAESSDDIVLNVAPCSFATSIDKYSQFASSSRRATLEDEQEANSRQKAQLEKWGRVKDVYTHPMEQGQSRTSWSLPQTEHASSSGSKDRSHLYENCSRGFDAVTKRDTRRQADYSLEVVDDQGHALDKREENLPSSATFLDTRVVDESELKQRSAEDIAFDLEGKCLSSQGSSGRSPLRWEIEEEEDEIEDSIHRRLGRDDGLIDSRKFDYFPTQSRNNSRFSSIREAVEDDVDLDNQSRHFVYRKKGKDAASFLQPLHGDYYEDEGEIERKSEESWDKDYSEGAALLLVCRSLDHASSLGLTKTNNRLRPLINWLVQSLTKLHHPNRDNLYPLVQIHGPMVKSHRGAALAFNLVDVHGELLQPAFVQSVAEKNNISLLLGFISNTHIRNTSAHVHGLPSPSAVNGKTGRSQKRSVLPVLTISLGFLSNFEDVYQLWVFVAKFLNSEFVMEQKSLHTASDDVQ